MKSKPGRFCFVLVAAMTLMGSARAFAQIADDSISALLFPPDLLLNHRDQIGLSDEQAERIRARAREAGPRADKHQMQLHQSMGQLAKLLSENSVDVDSALRAFDEVLAHEKDLKQLHLRLMIEIRNDLSVQQRRRASAIQQSQVSGQDTERRLRSKIALIQKAIESRAKAGQSPFEAVALMQKFPELMRNGQVREADALLNKVMTLLGIERASKANQTLPPAKQLSPDQVQAQVEALEKKAVAWRQIPWKTCLLEGLKASREQRKPIILWVFIDRPIDDERC